ncbi:N-acetylmuramoyl-L-alanine amidase [Paenibacillus chitinolyticus]|uniref:N-acetylmuramoyl-L-alanine amidase n=1 Tax=Paenibacillus chitinolyticus TaxID=79263 RepID=A0A410X265_9BACL|nr:N-acetylmuramoyl-L-alanine amidase [Paenibacillus chitinolyticus]MCY9593535.1 N-acetylmuramoyl-L-alanine amidase [Paenibacillus chitinolyticus]MCY9597506.1 N-acetylmuramoyl-L-alanine amidase [Paenibacillus chitinolyticus]QAV20704.1 N-acetylmuramoyl-L-alanine amidase [Paenibacillus chitinolyticus]
MFTKRLLTGSCLAACITGLSLFAAACGTPNRLAETKALTADTASQASKLAADAKKSLTTGKAHAESLPDIMKPAMTPDSPLNAQPPKSASKTNSHINPPDVLIDVGHGGIDGGAVHGDLLEKDINLAVAKQTYQLLTTAGYRVVLNRDKDYALSDDNKWLNNRSRHIRDLAQRMQMANDLKPKLLISLHVNSSFSRSKKGPYVLHQNSAGSLFLATQIQERLNAISGTRHLPILGKTYYLLKRAQSPSVIVEIGFITNAEDRARMTSAEGQQKIAAAIRDAVAAYITHGDLGPGPGGSQNKDSSPVK